MNSLQNLTQADLSDLIALLARKTMAAPSMIRPFAAYTEFLTELLRLFYRPGARLLAAGHVMPDVEIAADRAEIDLMENIGPSPFTGDIEILLKAVTNPYDIIYVANPNKVTGANFSAADLQRMAEAVPEGALLVDEYYFEFFGISAAPLLAGDNNIVILRSFAGPFGIRSDESGYVISSSAIVTALEAAVPPRNFSLARRKAMSAALMNEEALGMLVREVHDESLRLATELNRLGVQCRLTATDFVLLRVNDPVAVGNELTRAKISVDNLDGFPAMQHYLRYRIQSPLSNDNLIGAFGRMDPTLFRMKSIDRRAITMRLKTHREEPVPTTTTPNETENEAWPATFITRRPTTPATPEKAGK